MESNVISGELANNPLPPLQLLESTLPDREFSRLQIDPLWLSAPQEGTRQFQQLFVSVSCALQTALRLLVPTLYFSDPLRYGNPKLAYPLLVYAASKPLRGRRSGQFTYDPLETDVMLYFQRTVRIHMPAMLRGISSGLCAAGMSETAADYEPRHAAKIMLRVLRRAALRKRLHGLLTIEAQLLRALIELSGKDSLSERSQASALFRARELWESRFRRLYASQDHSSIAADVLAASTEALRARQSFIAR